MNLDFALIFHLFLLTYPVAVGESLCLSWLADAAGSEGLLGWMMLG